METKFVTADEIVDARGLSCPMPMLKTKKALKGLKDGQVLEVWGTDPGSANDIPDFVKKHGSELLSMQSDAGGYTRYIIEKR